MAQQGNVISINEYKQASQQALLDDISAQAFMFLREEARNNNVPMKALILEHLLGLALVIKAVEGEDEAVNILAEISKQLVH